MKKYIERMVIPREILERATSFALKLFPRNHLCAGVIIGRLDVVTKEADTKEIFIPITQETNACICGFASNLYSSHLLKLQEKDQSLMSIGVFFYKEFLPADLLDRFANHNYESLARQKGYHIPVVVVNGRGNHSFVF